MNWRSCSSKKARLIRAACSVLCGLLPWCVLLYGLWFFWFSPLPKQLETQPVSPVLTAAGGELLGATIAKDEQWRFPAVSHLPQKYLTALLVFEDKRFYQHPGVDPLAIARAIKLNWQQQKIISGGSTITMQLARLLQGNQPRTLWQKIQELCLAMKLEAQLSKQQILIYYSAMAPFGGNTVGLGAALWRYFGASPNWQDTTPDKHTLSDRKTRKQSHHQGYSLSWAQAALLAVLPNNPASIHLGKNRQYLLKKRNHLLNRLHSEGHITAFDLTLALREPLPLKPHAIPRQAPHLLSTLLAQHPYQHLFSSFIGAPLQRHLLKLTQSYGEHLQHNNIHNVAVVVIHNASQQVIAYLGNQANGDSKSYAPAVDIAQQPRSSGSLFKPLLFAQMVQQGDILPDSLVPDIPSYYRGYQPRNYDRQYRGVVPAKLALSQSLNVPAVRMLQQYGINRFKEDLQRIGLTTLWRPGEDYGLSLILGGAETTLWEITNAFSRLVLSAGGQQVSQPVAALSKLSSGVDNRLSKPSPFPITQGAAWLTLQALFEVNRPGVAANWKAFNSSQNIAWKTGTSYGWHDAWAVGSNGHYTVGVWAGNANGEEARMLSGTTTAAPLMFDTFSFLPVGEWPAQPLSSLKHYQVCRQDGYLPSNGCETVEKLAPISANFITVSPYHQRVHVDNQQGQRVHGHCEKPSQMTAKTVFVLPPLEAHYYALQHPQMAVMPGWRPDCQENLPALVNEQPIAFEYPPQGAVVKIPIQLNGTLGRVVLKARHRETDSVLFWHLDKRFLGKTHHRHEKSVVVNPGWHQLTVIDAQGFSIKHWFKAI